MDEQTMRTVISVLRQKMADLEWENVCLQAEVIRLTSEQPERVGNPTQGEPHEQPPT
jgi:hypothetical protein